MQLFSDRSSVSSCFILVASQTVASEPGSTISNRYYIYIHISRYLKYALTVSCICIWWERWTHSQWTAPLLVATGSRYLWTKRKVTTDVLAYCLNLLLTNVLSIIVLTSRINAHRLPTTIEQWKGHAKARPFLSP